MENLNLLEILKDAPKGTKLYSPIIGECELDEISKENELINVKTNTGYYTFYKKGSYYRYFGECLLFPSKDNHDWLSFRAKEKSFQTGDHVIWEKTGEVYLLIEKKQTRGFGAKMINSSSASYEVYIRKEDLIEYEKVEKFNPEWLKLFDRVLVRNCRDDKWFASFFSHSRDNLYIAIDGYSYKYCIPCNEETKSLLGTDQDVPEFYKI